MSLSVSFTAIHAKERQLDANKLIGELIVAADKMTDVILKDLKKYPPQRNPDSRYVRRKGRGIRGGWRKVREYNGDSVRIRLVNRVRGVRYVQGRRHQQARIHQDWWEPAQEIGQAYRSEFNLRLRRLRQKRNGVVGG